MKGVLIWKHTSKCLDVPYGDHFYQEETWTVLSTSDTVERCVLRAVNKIVWVKSTMFFEGKIRGRATEDMIKYFTKWNAWITERGFMEDKVSLKKSSTMKNKSIKSSSKKGDSPLKKRSKTLLDMSLSTKSQLNMEVEQ